MGKFSSYIDAGYPVIHLRTIEEERALTSSLDELGGSGLSRLKPFVWKVTTGLYPYGEDPDLHMLAKEPCESILFTIKPKGVYASNSDRVFFFFGLRHFLEQPDVIQTLRDASYELSSIGSHIVIIGPDVDLPAELQDVVTTLDFQLPSKETLTSIFENLTDEYGTTLDEIPSIDDLQEAAENARGLSAFRAENAAALSLVTRKKLDVSLIREEKRQIIKKTEALQYIEVNETMDDLGGFDVLKSYVSVRRSYFENTSIAKESGIINPPRGVLLIGLPGTGKSLGAKCIAGALGLSLYRLDLGAVFRSYVGESEAQIRSALRVVDAVSPCVLLLDEFEKMVAGLESSSRSDSGITSRVIAFLLSWMQDTDAPVYKVGTANTLRGLDGALMRRGRWDAVFSVDLPTDVELCEIYKIHLTKRGIELTDAEVNLIASKSLGFVGSEVEGVVEEAVFKAFSGAYKVTVASIIDEIDVTVPLSMTDNDEVVAFREWISEGARSVSSKRRR